MRRLSWALAAALAFAHAAAVLGQPAPRTGAEAPQPPPAVPPVAGLPGFLFLNQERILTGSRAGQALLAEEEAARDKLRAEARGIDTAFEAEEKRLTELRPTLPPEEFRAMADAFDARVVEARREQDERSTALAQEFDQRRRQFYARVAPILVMLMDRHGAQAIFDENSVLLADQSINITEEVVAEIDARAEQPEPEPGAGAEGE
jgi:Skp family chaperone for outer membrane proteins